MQRSPQFIGYTYTPAGITLHWLCPIACQSITARQATALVAANDYVSLLDCAARYYSTTELVLVLEDEDE